MRSIEDGRPTPWVESSRPGRAAPPRGADRPVGPPWGRGNGGGPTKLHGRHRKCSRLRLTTRGRRFFVLLFLAVFIPTTWSFASALTGPGSAPLSARAVEWFSEHGGRRLVTLVEQTWYNLHKPPVGGTPKGGIPTEAAGGGATAGETPGSKSLPQHVLPPHLPKPPDVTPIVAHPLKNEGLWQAAGARVDGIPTIYAAFFRPDTVHTSLVAGVAWMDTRLLKAVLVPGIKDPGGSGWGPWYGEVPVSARPELAAAFNSGFYIRDSRGGYFSQGRTVKPLVDGAASLVIYKDGTATVAKWGRDATMGPNIQSVRQNLPLIVDNGRPVPGLSADFSATWGQTYHDTVLAWRAAVGVTRDGALLFGAGDGLSAVSLANVMARAGAVRAMEMDINHVWVTFNFYSPDPRADYGEDVKRLLPGMWDHPHRYLTLDERDFVAMLIRPQYAHPSVP